MIYDSLKHMEAYQGVHPGIYKGLELLRDTDFSKLEDARVEVDGEKICSICCRATSPSRPTTLPRPTRSMWTSSF